MRSLSMMARLLLSHLVLLGVAVSVVAIAFVLILNTRPAPPQQAYQRLAAVAQSFPLGELLPEPGSGAFFNRQAFAAELTAELNVLAAERSVRILIIGARSNVVVFDSADVFEVGETLDARREPYTLPQAFRRGFSPRVEIVFGSFDDPSGEWLFTGLIAGSQGGAQGALLFADPRETQSLQQALADFGAALALPLCQASLVGLVFAIVLAFVGSRNIAQPLQQLAAASAEVAQGDYDQRVPPTGPPEVRAVAEAFNEMTGEVKATQQAQSDFLANVSHDLKTPLTSIQGYSQAIMDGATRDPVSAAKIIHEEAGRLNRMVMQLTDLARLQAGRLTMTLTPLDVGQITAAVAERLSIVAQEKGLYLRVDAPPMPDVLGDGDRLAQVLTNLISNAIKYTHTGGVTVSTRVGNGGVEVVIKDTGIGIPPDELPRIFERFYQVDKARGPERGTGLGLAIVHEIVHAHGGRIEVASAGVGKGATFTLWLPAVGMSTVAARRR